MSPVKEENSMLEQADPELQEEPSAIEEPSEVTVEYPVLTTEMVEQASPNIDVVKAYNEIEEIQVAKPTPFSTKLLLRKNKVPPSVAKFEKVVIKVD